MNLFCKILAGMNCIVIASFATYLPTLVLHFNLCLYFNLIHTLLFFPNRVEQLEKQQSENLERFKVRTKELKTSVSKELQEATLDAAGNVFITFAWFIVCWLGVIRWKHWNMVWVAFNMSLIFFFRFSIHFYRSASVNSDQEQGTSTNEKSGGYDFGPAHRDRTILSRSSAGGMCLRWPFVSFFFVPLGCILYAAYMLSYNNICFLWHFLYINFSIVYFILCFQVKEVIRKERHRNQQETRRALNKLKSGAGVLASTSGPTTNPGKNWLWTLCCKTQKFNRSVR